MTWGFWGEDKGTSRFDFYELGNNPRPLFREHPKQKDIMRSRKDFHKIFNGKTF